MVYGLRCNFHGSQFINNSNRKEESGRASVELQERIRAIPIDRYRNFSIVAHVDHGKSTLSDRLLELTGVIQKGSKAQVLDRLDVERERGITVKAQTCTMLYNHKGEDYLLHLVDTPGHVDFRSEVSRSYASCKGALLLVDASQGVQAQTVANFYLAYSMGLRLIPVINKIDMDAADIPRSLDQIEHMFELDTSDVVKVSAKTGLNVEQVLPAVVEKIAPPSGIVDSRLRLLLVDSWYDNFLGVVCLVYISDGSLKKGQKIFSAHTDISYDVKEVGIMYPIPLKTDIITAGQVGYMVIGMKKSSEAHIGDTFFTVGQAGEPLAGFEEAKPMVFVGAFPADGVEFKVLDESISHLVLNDRSVTLQKETSTALGQGWRLGFLGTLHASVFQERLEKEHGASIIITAPTVPYRILYNDDTEKIISNPDDFPSVENRQKVSVLQEPFVEAIMTFPQEYLGRVIKLCEAHRGEQVEITYLTTGQVLLKYLLPMAQLVDDFFGRLKGLTQGYASLDYEEAGYRPSDLVKMELLVNGKGIDALAQVMHRSETVNKGKVWVSKFKEYLKYQLFEVVIQAKAGNKIMARETIKAKRKDVLAKLHAADISRRKKLLSRQKEGKKSMKSIGNIQIPQEAYQGFLSRAPTKKK
ncbi:translation factor GUF1, mitochondrial [Nadsonia fulvescens var. elongata DSM 6958]|uniref:Translation factor GUF1, mitochondrial n=1 Tax=Nadsonia fulvescens var. elongata DSM 6958 TaxID=857566 RepID=A0A1E3PIL8_9ASCO|nr:translation factor GUF1, mitochondrial [Nadsonia fulvescens var. elongata DSM 6958]